MLCRQLFKVVLSSMSQQATAKTLNLRCPGQPHLDHYTQSALLAGTDAVFAHAITTTSKIPNCVLMSMLVEKYCQARHVRKPEHASMAKHAFHSFKIKSVELVQAMMGS